MKNLTLTYVAFLFILIIGCSKRTHLTTRLNYELANSKFQIADSVKYELEYWASILDTASNSYSITKEYYVPYFLEYYFVTLESNRTKFAAYKQDPVDQNFEITKAEYDRQVWFKIDSLVSEFWNKPTEIPLKVGVSDGHHVFMNGRRNGLSHDVSCNNPDLQDPEFDSLTLWITHDLYWNSIFKHIKKHNETVDNSR